MTLILLCTANWWVHFEYLAISGLPLTFAMFYMFWNLSLFPTSMYTTSFKINVFDVASMLVLIDGLQTCCHYSAPHDAFFTGFVDAITQLILPLYLVLLLVQPSRYSAILFGCMYCWWLLFIHSDPQKDYPWLEGLRSRRRPAACTRRPLRGSRRWRGGWSWPLR